MKMIRREREGRSGTEDGNTDMDLSSVRGKLAQVRKREEKQTASVDQEDAGIAISPLVYITSTRNAESAVKNKTS